MQTFDLETFQVGSVVNILDIPEFQRVTITRISDSGVSVKGPSCPNEIVLSGKSPAILNEEKPKNFMQEVSNQNPSSSSDSEVKNRAPRGSLSEKMKSVKTPDGEFTVKDVAELNGIPVPYANKWVKDNCIETGEAPKPAGQRGRASKLFKRN